MIDPTQILIDVIELSKQRCSHPIRGQLAYASKENFLGRIAEGYRADAAHLCLLAPKAAEKLCQVQMACIKHGLSLFIFDAFRPLRAVRDFGKWFHDPPASDYEKERAKIHFPHLKKEDLPRLGYAAGTVSVHCFGGAVDLSLIHLHKEELLDMGTEFDYFGEESHQNVSEQVIGQKAVQNRQLLTKLMQEAGFNPYPFEWWHFEYQEREVKDPMDMEISPSLYLRSDSPI